MKQEIRQYGRALQRADVLQQEGEHHADKNDGADNAPGQPGEIGANAPKREDTEHNRKQSVG